MTKTSTQLIVETLESTINDYFNNFDERITATANMVKENITV